MVEGTGLENRQARKRLEGSNPSPSATFSINSLNKRHFLRQYSLLLQPCPHFLRLKASQGQPCANALRRRLVAVRLPLSHGPRLYSVDLIVSSALSTLRESLQGSPRRTRPSCARSPPRSRSS